MHHNGTTLTLTKADLHALQAYAGKPTDATNRYVRFRTVDRILQLTASDGKRSLIVRHCADHDCKSVDVGIDVAFLAQCAKLIKRAQWQTIELDLLALQQGAGVEPASATVIEEDEESGPSHGATITEHDMVTTQVSLPGLDRQHVAPAFDGKHAITMLANPVYLANLQKVALAADTLSCEVFSPGIPDTGILVEFHPKNGDLWSVWMPQAGSPEQEEAARVVEAITELRETLEDSGATMALEVQTPRRVRKGRKGGAE